MNSFDTDSLLAHCRTLAPARTAIVHAVTANVLQAAQEAQQHGLITPVLVGPAARTREAAEAASVDISGWQLVDAEHSHDAAAKAVALAAAREVDALMKGSLHSDELMGAVVKSDAGLRTERRISHAFLIDQESYSKAFLITDAAVNIAPDLATKVDIVQNAVDLWHALFGADILPNVAVLAAVETVNPKMVATLDAAALCKMADRGQITGALLDGPLALDNAVSMAAAEVKQLKSPVAGRANVLLVPDLETGNVLAKSLTFMAGADAAGIVLGARVPIILTSRADSVQARLASCAVAALIAHSKLAGAKLLGS